MGEGRTFVYQDRDDDLLRKRVEDKGFVKSNSIFKADVNVFKPHLSEEKGKQNRTNKIRILPPTWDNPQHYGLEVWVHYNIGAGDFKSSFICNKLTKGGKCPICEQIAAHKDDKEYVKQIKATRKVIVYLIDRDDDEETVAVKAWTLPVGLDRNLAFQANDEDSGKVLKIDHPERGYDVSFETKRGLGTDSIPYTYEGEKISRYERPIFTDKEKMDAVLQFITENPIPEILNFKEYDEIKDVFEGRVTTTFNPVNIEKEPETVKKEVVEKTVKEDFPNPIEDLVPTKYGDLEKMEREDLEDVAIDELGMKSKEVRSLSKEALVGLIASKKGLKEPKKPLTGKEEMRKKIKSLKKK